MERVITGQEQWAVAEGDCLSLLQELPDSSVDLVATDPPYYRVKNLPWDRQWDSADGFIEWIGLLCEQWQRVLKPNGSLYVFASPRMAARVECEMGRRFAVLNRIRWMKSAYTHRRCDRTKLRSYLSSWEGIIFAEHFGSDNRAMGSAGWVAQCDELRGFVFEPLRAYLDGERRRAGVGKDECNLACGFSLSAGGMASRHYFSQSQWAMPTTSHYAALRDLFNARGNGSGPYLQREHSDLRREYEDLRREYEDLRREYEDLRRPFSVSAEVPHTDVWDFSTVPNYRGKHPCEKPVAMMEHIIRTSSRADGLILDCFSGSGVTGHAAVSLGRRYIGMELDPHWCEVSRQRIAGCSQQLQPQLIGADD